jgi:hypothetical protein
MPFAAPHPIGEGGFAIDQALPRAWITPAVKIALAPLPLRDVEATIPARRAASTSARRCASTPTASATALTFGRSLPPSLRKSLYGRRAAGRSGSRYNQPAPKVLSLVSCLSRRPLTGLECD